VIGETILHDIAASNATGMQETPHTPPIDLNPARLIDRAGGLENMPKPGYISGGKSPKHVL
jgi:hypothetical protein